MKKILSCLLALCLLLPCLPALAEDVPQVQVVYTNVNFRSSPGGHVIGRFAGGEMLTYIEEKHAGGYLWYYVKSEAYGDGYINATCAMPYVEGEPHWGDEDYSPVTPSLQQYTLDLAGWKLEHHVGGWNECNEFSHTHYSNWDAVLPAADIVDMMLENHIMLQNSQTEPFTTAETEEAREKAALKILKIHYNVDSVWELFIRSPKYPNNIGFGDDLIQLEDWHRIYPPTSEEFGSMYKEIHKAYRPDGQ